MNYVHLSLMLLLFSSVLTLVAAVLILVRDAKRHRDLIKARKKEKETSEINVYLEMFRDKQ